VKIEKSLVAGVWGTGVVASRGAKLHVSDTDIRNCYHRCVTLTTDDATIERCRISGSAWHGIRYDDCSPKILSNHIFANARSGIYASGKTAATVRGNVFWKNEMDAMSCWFDNQDSVDGNTILGNLREGISVLGGSKTKLARNVFVQNPVAVEAGKIAARGQRPQSATTGEPMLQGNFFFKNPKDFAVADADKPLPPGNETADPKVGDAAANFRLAADSPARHANAGAADPIAFASPFAIQPQEKSMIPESETRDYAKWKKVASAR
jgi:parallel beta-helix repeat protein